MRQQIPFIGSVGDAAEQVVEPGKRIEFHQFARSNEAAHDGLRPALGIAPEKGRAPPLGANGFVPPSLLSIIAFPELFLIMMAHVR
jgi:hypothetical protein